MIIPSPAEIRAARNEIGLTQKQASRIAHVSLSAWQRYEMPAGSDGYREISGAAWELFLIKTEKLRPEGSKFTFRRGRMPPPI